jgi:glycerate 2-kinase
VTRFDDTVLQREPSDRAALLSWLDAGLKAVDPQALVREALSSAPYGEVHVIAIGKAAAAMTRGVAQVMSINGGVVVSDHEEPVPVGVQHLIGDHPIPGQASVRAAKAVLAAVARIPEGEKCIALISGGGSALCELPRPGVPHEFIATVNAQLIGHAAGIEEINLVRCHLSDFKGGGVARAARRPIDTFVISDVAGADPGVVASGPTVHRAHEPDRAMSLLKRFGIEVPDSVRDAIFTQPPPTDMPHLTLLADGHDAAQAVARSAVADSSATHSSRLDAVVRSEWLEGDVQGCVDWMLSIVAGSLTVAVGEPVVEVTGHGRGGRNTHAALLMARRIAGTEILFAALATDGVDGFSGSAGAMVDGKTIALGGDPTTAIQDCDSAEYLERTSDLLSCEPTGTNVADLWALWRRNPTLAVE